MSKPKHTENKTNQCVCGTSRPYSKCCQPFHQGKQQAASAEVLMRSRYSAYVWNLYDYIRETWYPSTCPADLQAPEIMIHWLGLSIKKAWTTQEDEAFVEFVARSRTGNGAAERLHEISRFVKENGRWLYVDGEFLK